LGNSLSLYGAIGSYGKRQDSQDFGNLGLTQKKLGFWQNRRCDVKVLTH
jgi:hypothetical protein